jgi:DNA-binding transcriptional ArsR family regulator
VSGYSEHLAEIARLALLTALADAPGYTLNSVMAHTVLSGAGLPLSRDRVATEIAWLAEQGLLTARAQGQWTVAELTTRGLDVAQGLSTVPGVARPEPCARP